MLDTLSERLSQALAEQWSYTQFLDMLLTDEAERRDFKQLGRRLTKSGLAPDKTLETFDFSFNPRIHAPTLRELATCRFVERAENVLVHHMAKRSRRNLGQSLRGSSISMPGPTPPAISCAAPTTVCNSPSSTAPLPLPTPSCCASQAAATSPSRCSSTALTPRRPRSPRRSAPLSAALASRSPGPSCANACASTTLVSVSPSKLSINAASPSAAPTAGTCRHDPHPRLPTRSHPVTVPLQARTRNGTTTATLRVIYPATNLGPGRATQHRSRSIDFNAFIMYIRERPRCGFVLFPL